MNELIAANQARLEKRDMAHWKERATAMTMENSALTRRLTEALAERDDWRFRAEKAERRLAAGSADERHGQFACEQCGGTGIAPEAGP